MRSQIAKVALVVLMSIVAGAGSARAQGKQARSESAEWFRGQAAAHERLSPRPLSCALGISLSADLHVLALGAATQQAGLRRGDRLVRSGDTSLESPADVVGALGRTAAGAPIEAGVFRDGREMVLSLPCRNHGDVWNATRQVFDAGSSGAWDRCLAAANDVVRLSGIASSQDALFKYQCMLGSNRARGRSADATEANLLYDFVRMSLDEAQYQPDGISKVRGMVLANVDYLRQAGFKSLGDDLAATLRQLSEAASNRTTAPSSPPVSVPPVPRDEPQTVPPRPQSEPVSVPPLPSR